MQRHKMVQPVCSCAIFAIYCVCLALSGNVKPRNEKYLPDYNLYHNLTRTFKDLAKLAKRYPQYIALDDTKYTSKQGRPQPFLVLTDSSVELPKINVLFSYGEHAREFFPVESMFNFIATVVSGLDEHSNSDQRAFSKLVLSRFNVHIVPMLNPDGRNYAETTRNYCWRGTSTGVDLNRNFDWQFGGRGSSDNAQDEEYRGTEVFSEKECLILRQLTDDITFTAFVSFHSGIKQIYLPFSDTSSKLAKRLPRNYDNMRRLAEDMASATGNSFTYGVAWQLNEYTADGTIFDYMAGTKKIPFSLAIELWGVGDHKGAQCFDLFNPESKDLQKSLENVFPIYSAFFNFLAEWKDELVSEQLTQSVELETPSLSFTFLPLACVIILFIGFYGHSKLPYSWRLFPVRKVVSLRSLSSSFSVMKISTK